MPRYFFDVDDGERQIRDEVGIDLADRTGVICETQILLQYLSLAVVATDRSRIFTAVVRDEMDVEIYKGWMVLATVRTGDHS